MDGKKQSWWADWKETDNFHRIRHLRHRLHRTSRHISGTTTADASEEGSCGWETICEHSVTVARVDHSHSREAWLA